MHSQGGGYTARERQPPGGRALDGGLRIGEMERDAVLAHGLQTFLKESMMERSDKFSCFICDTSGRLAVANQFDSNIYYSPDIDGPVTYHMTESAGIDGIKQQNDDNSYHKLVGVNIINQKAKNFSQIQVPYTFKLLIQECESIAISIRLISENNIYNFNQLPIDKDLLEFEPDIDDYKAKAKKGSFKLRSFTKTFEEEMEEDNESNQEDNESNQEDNESNQEDNESNQEDKQNEIDNEEDKKENKKSNSKSKSKKVSKSSKSIEQISKDLEPEDSQSGGADKEHYDKETNEPNIDNVTESQELKEPIQEGGGIQTNTDNQNNEVREIDNKDGMVGGMKLEVEPSLDKFTNIGGGMKLEVEPSLDKFTNIGGGSSMSDEEKNKALQLAAADLDNASQKLKAASANMEEALPALEPRGNSSTNNARNSLANLLNRRRNAMDPQSQQGGDMDPQSQQGGDMDPQSQQGGDLKIIKLSQNIHSLHGQEQENKSSTDVNIDNSFDIKPNYNPKRSRARYGGNRNQLYTQDRNQLGGHNDFGSDNEDVLNEVFL
jgi:DNA-directed RNA polymerase beta subunit